MIANSKQFLRLIDVINRNGYSPETWGVLTDVNTNTRNYFGVRAMIPLKGDYLYIYLKNEEETLTWDNIVCKPDMVFDFGDDERLLVFDLNYADKSE